MFGQRGIPSYACSSAGTVSCAAFGLFLVASFWGVKRASKDAQGLEIRPIIGAMTEPKTSFDRPSDPAILPSPWVLRWAGLIAPGGTVLDLAAGHGRHARALAQRGHWVTAVDLDVTGLDDLRAVGPHPPVEIIAADLEGGVWPLAGREFAGIVVTNYLHRPHFPHLAASLSPGGVLIFETFGQGNELFGRPRNPAFLLAPGELLTAFMPHLDIVAYEHGSEQEPRPAVRQRLCAVKGGGPVAL
jgi:SAM-dependent methyltransferase